MFLNSMSAEEMNLIERIGVVRHFPQGSSLMVEGEIGSSFMLVLTGTVEVRKRLRGGKYKKLVVFKACDLIGEIAFLGVQPRTASVVALEDTEVIEFERNDFLRLIEKHPAIGVKAYRGMAEELAQRLSRSGEELMNAIAWALGGPRRVDEDSESITVPPQLRLTRQKVPSASDPAGKV